VNGYRVKFWNPATGKGHIDGYKLAGTAKQIVEKWNALYDKMGQLDGIRAEYLGKRKERAAQ
jgi:hypothetical protein